MASDNDELLLNLDVPFDSNLSWDPLDQSFMRSKKFSIAGDPETLALTRGSDNSSSKKNSRKREAALCSPDRAPNDFSGLKMPALPEIESLCQPKKNPDGA